MTTTICHLAKLLVVQQSPEEWKLTNGPLFEYTAGEPPDSWPLLDALVPQPEAKDLLKSCGDIQYFVTNRDGTQIDPKIFSFDLTDQILTTETNEQSIIDHQFAQQMTLWAKFSFEENFEEQILSLENFTVDVSADCSKPNYLLSEDPDFSELAYEYGAKVDFDPSQGFLSAPKRCEIEFECKMVKFEDMYLSLQGDLCSEDQNSDLTQIIFDKTTGFYSFWTIDYQAFPQGATFQIQIRAIIGPLSATRSTKFVIRNDMNKIISEENEKFSRQGQIITLTDNERRNLQDCSQVTEIFAFFQELKDKDYVVDVNEFGQNDLDIYTTIPSDCPLEYDASNSVLTYPTLILVGNVIFINLKKFSEEGEYDINGKVSQDIKIEIQIKAKDNDYKIIDSFILTLVNPCSVDTYYKIPKGDGPGDFEYTVGDVAKTVTHGVYMMPQVQFERHRDKCGPITYSATFDGVQVDLNSSPVSYDVSTRTFSIFSDDSNFAGEHEIVQWAHLELYPTNVKLDNYNKAKVTIIYIDPCSFQQTLNVNNDVFTDKVYSLSNLQVGYQWNIDDILLNPEPNCALVVEFFYQGGDSIDTDIFKVNLVSDPQTFSVLYTEDVEAVGIYMFQYRAYFQGYKNQAVTQSASFQVQIIDPCDNPNNVSIQAPPNLLNVIEIYMITEEAKEIQFSQFLTNPSQCSEKLSYELQTDSILADLVVQSFDPIGRTIKFEYSQDLVPLDEDPLLAYKNYELTIVATIQSGRSVQQSFTLRVTNPCTAQSGLSDSQKPKFCPAEVIEIDYYNPIMPLWLQDIESRTIMYNEEFYLPFGPPVNQFGQPLVVELSHQRSLTKPEEDFIKYNEDENSIIIFENTMSKKDLGYHKLNFTATEERFGKVYHYEKLFYLHVIKPDSELPPQPPPPKPEPEPTPDPNQNGQSLLSSSLIRGDGDIKAFVEGFDPTGLFTIRFLKKIVPPQNLTELNQKQIVVKGEPIKRNLQDLDNDQIDEQFFDIIVPVKESQEEFDLFKAKFINLYAIEVKLIDDYQNHLDIKFSWNIEKFTEDQLSMKFQFEDSTQVSEDFEFNTRVKVTFWDISLFKYQDGEELPFGASIEWQVIRQMQTEEEGQVNGMLIFTSILFWFAGIAILILVLTFGPLLPVWMFINTMQLIVHVPLIRTKLPGNSHQFLLDHLNVLRMQFFGLNAWLNRTKAEDSALVSRSQVDRYTTLVYQSGYSFDFFANLVLILIMFLTIAFIWIMVIVRDQYYHRYRVKSNMTKMEPKMTNFVIRFLYEVFFEICVCLMINVSYLDSDSQSQVFGFVFCMILVLLAFVALLAISVLCWKDPTYAKNFNKQSCLKKYCSFWDKGTLNDSAIQKAKEELRKRGELLGIENKNTDKAQKNDSEFSSQDLSGGEDNQKEKGFFIPMELKNPEQILSKQATLAWLNAGKEDDQPGGLLNRKESNAMQTFLLNRHEQKLVDNPIFQESPAINSENFLDMMSIRAAKQNDQLEENSHNSISSYKDNSKALENQNKSQILRENTTQNPLNSQELDELRQANVSYDPARNMQLLSDLSLDQITEEEKSVDQKDQRLNTDNNLHNAQVQKLNYSIDRNSQDVDIQIGQQQDNYEGGETEFSQQNCASEMTTRALLKSDKEPTNSLGRQSTKFRRIIDTAKQVTDAKMRIELEKLTKINPRYQTLFNGLRIDHPRKAYILHPMAFLIRRLIFSAIVIFMLTLPLIAAYLLCMTCVLGIAFTIQEKQWEDSMVLKINVVNEVALYLILLMALVCALPLPAAAVSPIGWFIITLTTLTLIFNMTVIITLTSQHAQRFIKKQRNIIVHKKIVAQKSIRKVQNNQAQQNQLDQKGSEDSNHVSSSHDFDNDEENQIGTSVNKKEDNDYSEVEKVVELSPVNEISFNSHVGLQRPHAMIAVNRLLGSSDGGSQISQMRQTKNRLQSKSHSRNISRNSQYLNTELKEISWAQQSSKPNQQTQDYQQDRAPTTNPGNIPINFVNRELMSNIDPSYEDEDYDPYQRESNHHQDGDPQNLQFTPPKNEKSQVTYGEILVSALGQDLNLFEKNKDSSLKIETQNRCQPISNQYESREGISPIDLPQNISSQSPEQYQFDSSNIERYTKSPPNVGPALIGFIEQKDGSDDFQVKKDDNQASLKYSIFDSSQNSKATPEETNNLTQTLPVTKKVNANLATDQTVKNSPQYTTEENMKEITNSPLQDLECEDQTSLEENSDQQAKHFNKQTQMAHRARRLSMSSAIIEQTSEAEQTQIISHRGSVIDHIKKDESPFDHRIISQQSSANLPIQFSQLDINVQDQEQESGINNLRSQNEPCIEKITEETEQSQGDHPETKNLDASLNEKITGTPNYNKKLENLKTGTPSKAQKTSQEYQQMQQIQINDQQNSEEAKIVQEYPSEALPQPSRASSQTSDFIDKALQQNRQEIDSQDQQSDNEPMSEIKQIIDQNQIQPQESESTQLVVAVDQQEISETEHDNVTEQQSQNVKAVIQTATQKNIDALQNVLKALVENVSLDQAKILLTGENLSMLLSDKKLKEESLHQHSQGFITQSQSIAPQVQLSNIDRDTEEVKEQSRNSQLRISIISEDSKQPTQFADPSYSNTPSLIPISQAEIHQESESQNNIISNTVNQNTIQQDQTSKTKYDYPTQIQSSRTDARLSLENLIDHGKPSYKSRRGSSLAGSQEVSLERQRISIMKLTPLQIRDAAKLDVNEAQLSGLPNTLSHKSMTQRNLLQPVAEKIGLATQKNQQRKGSVPYQHQHSALTGNSRSKQVHDGKNLLSRDSSIKFEEYERLSAKDKILAKIKQEEFKKQKGNPQISCTTETVSIVAPKQQQQDHENLSVPPQQEQVTSMKSENLDSDSSSDKIDKNQVQGQSENHPSNEPKALEDEKILSRNSNIQEAHFESQRKSFIHDRLLKVDQKPRLSTNLSHPQNGFSSVLKDQMIELQRSKSNLPIQPPNWLSKFTDKLKVPESNLNTQQQSSVNNSFHEKISQMKKTRIQSLSPVQDFILQNKKDNLLPATPQYLTKQLTRQGQSQLLQPNEQMRSLTTRLSTQTNINQAQMVEATSQALPDVPLKKKVKKNMNSKTFADALSGIGTSLKSSDSKVLNEFNQSSRNSLLQEPLTAKSQASNQAIQIGRAGKMGNGARNTLLKIEKQPTLKIQGKSKSQERHPELLRRPNEQPIQNRTKQFQSKKRSGSTITLPEIQEYDDIGGKRTTQKSQSTNFRSEKTRRNNQKLAKTYGVSGKSNSRSILREGSSSGVFDMLEQKPTITGAQKQALRSPALQVDEASEFYSDMGESRRSSMVATSINKKQKK